MTPSRKVFFGTLAPCGTLRTGICTLAWGRCGLPVPMARMASGSFWRCRAEHHFSASTMECSETEDW
eukprot:7263050-Pyramimonas_sp.AAC.1